jgi:hypothetical protein
MSLSLAPQMGYLCIFQNVMPLGHAGLPAAEQQQQQQQQFL